MIRRGRPSVTDGLSADVEKVPTGLPPEENSPRIKKFHGRRKTASSLLRIDEATYELLKGRFRACCRPIASLSITRTCREGVQSVANRTPVGDLSAGWLLHQTHFLVIFDCTIMQRGRKTILDHLLLLEIGEGRMELFKLVKVFENCFDDHIDDVRRHFCRAEVAPTPKVVTSSALPRYMPPGITAFR